jgi:hypothetical protein
METWRAKEAQNEGLEAQMEPLKGLKTSGAGPKSGPDPHGELEFALLQVEAPDLAGFVHH